MTADKTSVLIIEDDESLAATYKITLEREGYRVVTELAADRGLARAREDQFDVVLTDLHLAGPSDLSSKEGFSLIRQLRAIKPDLPIILMTGDRATEHAIEATKLGAYDYISKPFEPQDLLAIIQQAISASQPVSEPVELGGAAPAKDAIIGSSRSMQEVYKAIGRIAPTPVTVLIRGETGTGKELVARSLHRHSQRVGHPFIPVNCAAIPEQLLESELFGHERGAFTGAERRRIGRFEQADGGTIFLDEIGDMTIATQAKLLRVLQERTIRRLGADETIPVDVRVIAATHRNLEQGISEGTFREDLYYRLNVAVVQLPRLDDRREDIPDLVRFFIKRHGTDFGLVGTSITPDAINYLQRRPWPGHVRELENVVCKAMLLARGQAISADTLRAAIGQAQTPQTEATSTLAGYISDLLDRAIAGQMENVATAFTWDIERELYAQAIQRAGGNQVKAASWLGVSRPTLRKKLRLFGLLPERDRAESAGVD